MRLSEDVLRQLRHLVGLGGAGRKRRLVGQPWERVFGGINVAKEFLAESGLYKLPGLDKLKAKPNKSWKQMFANPLSAFCFCFPYPGKEKLTCFHADFGKLKAVSRAQAPLSDRRAPDYSPNLCPPKI